MKANQITFLIIFLFLSLNGYTQEVLIQGYVLSENAVPLVGATIQSGSNQGVATASDGSFELKTSTSEEGISLQIRMLGYQSLDTIIQSKLSKLFLEIRLKENYIDQPEVVISEEKPVNVFDENKWVILDANIYNDLLILIYIESNKRYLGFAKTNGTLIDKIKIKKRYKWLKTSQCTGKLYCLGEYDYAVLKINPHTTFELEEREGLSDYNAYIQPCLFKVGDNFVFRSYAKHNKVVNYFTYNEQKEQELLLRLSDQQAFKTAQSYFWEIISMYNRAVNNPQVGAIDEGIERVNILASGDWKGDIERLIVNNEIHFAVSYYKNIEAQPLETLEFYWQNKAYVFEAGRKRLFEISNTSKKPKTLKTKDAPFKKKQGYKVVQDRLANKNYLLDKKLQLHHLAIENNKVRLEPVLEIDASNSALRTVLVHDGVMYTVFQKNNREPYTLIERKKVD